MSGSSRWLEKFLASSLSLALTLTAPGLTCYEALGQMINAGRSGAPLLLPAGALGAAGGAASLELPAQGAQSPNGLSSQPLDSLAPLDLSPSKPKTVSAEESFNSEDGAPPADSRGEASAASAADATAGLKSARGAVGEAQAGRVDGAGYLGRLFDAQQHAGSEPQTAGAETSSLPPLTRGAFAGAARARLEAAPERPQAPQPPAASSRGLAATMVLAVLGGTAAFLASAHVPSFAPHAVSAWAAAHPAAAHSAAAAFGVLAGLSASEPASWAAFPSTIFSGAKASAVLSFRFWARFGLVFDAVLRGGDTGRAAKAELPANLFKYPLLAMPWVLVGCAAAPVAFSLGVAYKTIETPALAAFKALRRLVVEFFPALARALRTLYKVLQRLLPFGGGFLKGALLSASAGTVMGMSLFTLPFLNQYGARSGFPANAPAAAGLFLAKAVTLLLAIASGMVGGALGLALNLPFSLTLGLHSAMKTAGVGGSLFNRLDAWAGALEPEARTAELLSEMDFGRGPEVGAQERVVRLLNLSARSLYAVILAPILALVVYLRAWKGPASAKDLAIPSDGPAAHRASPPEPGYLGSVARRAAASAAMSFKAWALLGLESDAALRGRVLDEALAKERPLSPLRYPLLAWPAVLAGYGLSAAAFVLGGALEALARPAVFAWKKLVELLDAVLPFLKRIWREYLYPFLRRAVPFAAGLPAGAVKAVAQTGYAEAKLFEELFEGLVELGMASKGRLGPLVSVPLRLILGLGGPVLAFAAGAVNGLLLAPIMALSTASLWSDVGGRIGSFFKIWEQETLPLQVRALEPMTKGMVPEAADQERPSFLSFLTRAFVAAVSLPLLLASVSAAMARGLGLSLMEAFRHAGARFPNDSPEQLEGRLRALLKRAPGAHDIGRDEEGRLRVVFDTRKNLDAAVALGLVAPEMDGFTVRLYARDEMTPGGLPARPAPKVPAPAPAPGPAAPRPPLLIALGLGVLGTAAGLAAAPAAALTLAGWKLGAAWVLSAAAGTGLGLALSQPGFRRRLAPDMKAAALEAAGASRDQWSREGEGFASVMGGSKAWAAPFKALGLLSVLPSAAFGALYGAAADAARSAWAALKQVIEELLPFLKRALHLLARIARHIVPFAGGVAAGLAGGALGSAGFGAYLLGSPYFRYVVLERFEGRSFPQWTGRMLLKGAALTGGLAFGAIGLAAGALVALPFALTLAAGLGLLWGKIGGRTQDMLGLWMDGTLPEELHNLSRLTSKFDFSEPRRDGRLQLMDGWIRLANILPAAAAAAFAGVLGALVAYGRSLYRAYRELKAGKKPGP